MIARPVRRAALPDPLTAADAHHGPLDELQADVERIPPARGRRWQASTVRHVCMSVKREAVLGGIAA